MHIQKLAIQNFRNHRNSTIELDKMNIFIGRNNSGKSSILAAIEALTGRNRGPTVAERATWSPGKRKPPGGAELPAWAAWSAMPPNLTAKAGTSRKDRPPSTTIWGQTNKWCSWYQTLSMSPQNKKRPVRPVRYLLHRGRNSRCHRAVPARQRCW